MRNTPLVGPRLRDRSRKSLGLRLVFIDHMWLWINRHERNLAQIAPVC